MGLLFVSLCAAAWGALSAFGAARRRWARDRGIAVLLWMVSGLCAAAAAWLAWLLWDGFNFARLL